MKDKSITTFLFLGDECVAEGSTHTLNISDETLSKSGAKMQFYYRRGDRFFFRSSNLTLIVEAPYLKNKLKRGDYYDAEWSENKPE